MGAWLEKNPGVPRQVTSVSATCVAQPVGQGVGDEHDRSSYDPGPLDQGGHMGVHPAVGQDDHHRAGLDQQEVVGRAQA